MPRTIEDLILSIEVELEQAEKERARCGASIQQILNRATAEGRPSVSTEERADIDRYFARQEALDGEIVGINAKLTDARRQKTHEDRLVAEHNDVRENPRTLAGGKPAYDRVARISSEPRTYTRENCKRGKEFLQDVLAQYLHNDLEAQMRLSRHMAEERVERGQYLQRATGTGAFAGLTVPQYLTEMYAPAVAARRPFADICTKHDLPATGMTVNISRITTQSSVALQASENSAVSETDMDDTLLTENVQTAAGQQTISRQAIERGTGIEDVTMSDLQRRYATTLDGTLITQATTGLSAVAQSVAYTDGTPTPAELWPKILNALSNSEGVFLGEAAPTHAIMHPRRWYWMQSQVGTSWPFIAQPGIPTQAGGQNLAVQYDGGVRGVLPNGTLVIGDANVATNSGAGTEDEIYIVAQDECHLWEDPQAPQFIRAEQAKAANLGILLVLYGYFAYTFRRYTNGVQKINGTGLIAPTF